MWRGKVSSSSSSLAPLLKCLQIHFNLDFWISLELSSGRPVGKDLIFLALLNHPEAVGIFSPQQSMYFDLRLQFGINFVAPKIFYLTKENWSQFFANLGWMDKIHAKIIAKCTTDRGSCLTCLNNFRLKKLFQLKGSTAQVRLLEEIKIYNEKKHPSG